jgi:hypothetical protein
LPPWKWRIQAGQEARRMLATQLLFVDWFFQHRMDELARKNLEALHWIHRQGDKIGRRISCT